MSILTTTLLKRKPPRNSLRWQKTLAQVASILVSKYGTPKLGNYRDPVKEIFYIVLSAKTTERLYQAAYKRLWRRFRTLSEIARTSTTELHDCIAGAGLGAKRSAQLHEIACRLLADFGTNPGRGLRRLSAEDVYGYLRSLPGIGPKSAFCIMMYSLDFDVFPVDTHIHRVLCRIGLMRVGAKHYHAQDYLPAFIPEGCSKALHVALVTHGRRICTPRLPSCHVCVIRNLCKYGAKGFSLAHRTWTNDG